MEERQVVDVIMKSLRIEHLLPKVRDLANQYDIDTLTFLGALISVGCQAEQARFDWYDNDVKQRKKEKKQKKERNIYNNNNKEKTNLNKLNTRDNNMPQMEALFDWFTIKPSPLVAKLEAKKKSSKIERRVKMPRAWVEARENETIFLGVNLVGYAESQGYDWYLAKELFLAFVDYHLAKGSIFKNWEAAWRNWIRNDIKFNGGPATQTPGSVVQSYKKTDTIEELFNDD